MQKKLKTLSWTLRWTFKKDCELGVGISTVSVWKKKDFYYLKIFFNDSLGNLSNIKRAKLEMLDEVLFVWFCIKRDCGLPISGPVIQHKALNLNVKLLDGDPYIIRVKGGFKLIEKPA